MTYSISMLVRPMAEPMTISQKTLKTPIHCRGIGLHSGTRVEMTLLPAAADTGIRFRRSDAGNA
ncbi:MAG TPA: UDP-3-O-acyl-N-acetylglucosamine deacetylase, partial [Stellaceae bacterium]|nr:UDP-3-O-acyl-N-acetylglucosamine deacetylase [Stellaceae bacterium]